MLPVALDAVDKVLHDLLADLVAEGRVVIEDGAHRLRLQQPRRQEQLNVFVEERLILSVAQAKVLQELVGQPHELVHPYVLLLLVGDLEQVQDDAVNAHVPEKTLLVFTGLRRVTVALLDAKPVHPNQNLEQERKD